MNVIETDTFNKKVVRDSNLECLRLICMYYIVIHHILIHALHQVAGYDNVQDLSKYTIVSTILDSLLFVAVNSFILISGFFSIKLKMNRLIRLYVLCASYGALFYFLHLFLDHQSFGKSFLLNSLFVISNAPNWWFIQSYFFLCLLSPLLNSSTVYMNKKEHLSAILTLFFLNVYFGFFWRNPINSDGYNVMNFIFLYVIAQYVNKYISIPKLSELRNRLILIYLLLSLVLGLLILFVVFVLKQNNAKANILWAYNNPIVLISSIIFFCVFLTFNFKSRIINWLATSTLSIYLIHENSYVRQYIYDFIRDICNLNVFSNSIALRYIVIIIAALILMVSCILFDKLFQKIIKPIENMLIFLWTKIEIKYSTFIN
jgi:surface polysaccharide O-acyltransferase-like enzyme